MPKLKSRTGGLDTGGKEQVTCIHRPITQKRRPFFYTHMYVWDLCRHCSHGVVCRTKWSSFSWTRRRVELKERWLDVDGYHRNRTLLNDNGIHTANDRRHTNTHANTTVLHPHHTTPQALLWSIPETILPTVVLQPFPSITCQLRYYIYISQLVVEWRRSKVRF